jgi:hypothetical protein
MRLAQRSRHGARVSVALVLSYVVDWLLIV